MNLMNTIKAILYVLLFLDKVMLSIHNSVGIEKL